VVAIWLRAAARSLTRDRAGFAAVQGMMAPGAAILQIVKIIFGMRLVRRRLSECGAAC